MNSARSWIVFSGAVFAYLIGVTQRTSFGVLTVDATERFHANAAAVSTVAVVQIIVYAARQIPVGILVDRVGPRALIVSGAIVMAVGQAVLAVSPSIGFVIFARVLVGMGDAATFVLDAEQHATGSAFCAKLDPTASWRKLDGIAQQVDECLYHSFPISPD